MGIDSSFGLAIEPVLVSSASVASKSGADSARNDKPSLNSVQYETELCTASPNPFNPDTEIQFALREAAKATISVIDVSGRRIATLVDDSLEPGLHSVRWDGCDSTGRGVASGVYFVHMAAGGRVFSRRVLLVK